MATELTTQQHKAIVALLSQPTVTAAAEQVGVSRVTLYEWLKDPAFQEAYREARKDTLDAATARLQAGASDAAAALLGIVNNPEAPASARINAASKVLDSAYRGDLFADVDALLKKLQEDDKQ